MENNSVVNGVYQELVSKMRMIQEEEKYIDDSLIMKQEITLEQTKVQEEEERVSRNIRREMERCRQEREREEHIVKRQMERELDGIINKTAELEAEGERLKRMENRMAIAEDTLNIKKTSLEESLLYPYQHQADFRMKENRVHSRLPSFGL